jgi:flagellar biosynthesis protein FlhA
MADFAPKIKDNDMLTEYVRQALKRTISRKFSEAGQIKVVTLDASIENAIMGAIKKMDGGSYLALDQPTIQKIITATTRELDKIKDLVNDLIVITSPVVRIYFKKLVNQFYQNVTVLSFSEMDNDIQIQALGNIVLDN